MPPSAFDSIIAFVMPVRDEGHLTLTAKDDTEALLFDLA
jgi:hypothetical protein